MLVLPIMHPLRHAESQREIDYVSRKVHDMETVGFANSGRPFMAIVSVVFLLA